MHQARACLEFVGPLCLSYGTRGVLHLSGCAGDHTTLQATEKPNLLLHTDMERRVCK